jgi:hypothetical protein
MLVFLLAVLVTAGATFSAVQANTMAARMTMATTMGVADDHSCPDCNGGNADKMKQAACLTTCVTPAAIAIPAANGCAVPSTVAKHPLPKAALLVGSTLPPDPYPPRTIDIG